jgi:hypothetical protein
MKPDFDWQNYSIKRSIISFPNKRYLINFDEVYKLIGTEDKIEYFLQGHGVKIYVTNEGGSKMFLIITQADSYGLRIRSWRYKIVIRHHVNRRIPP